MVFLYFRNDKRLILTRTTDTYVNENKFETIKIICEKVIDGYNIENTTVQLNVIPPHGQAVDIINLDLIQDENVDSRLSTEIKIPIEYLQMSGDLKFQIKVYDKEVIGKSNIALFEIVNTLEVENFLTDNQLTMLDQYVTRFEKIASDLDKQLDENKNFPNIGTSIGKENENWWIWDNDRKEYIDTGVLAKANITVDNITFKITDSGILQVEYKNGEHFETTDLGKVVGDKGEKGDKGDNGVSIIDIRKTSSNELVDTYTIYYSNDTTSTFNITNGKNGTNGKDGINGVDGLKGDDGVSPVVELNKSENVTTLTITDKNGTQTVTINDGINGVNGKDGINGTNGVDGISPIIELNKTNNTTTLSIIDKDGTKSVDILDGEKGANGDDYVLTDKDKQDIATIVTGDLSNKLDSKQDKLIASENIKTVNGESLLGEGNIETEKEYKRAYVQTTEEVSEIFLETDDFDVCYVNIRAKTAVADKFKISYLYGKSVSHYRHYICLLSQSMQYDGNLNQNINMYKIEKIPNAVTYYRQACFYINTSSQNYMFPYSSDDTRNGIVLRTDTNLFPIGVELEVYYK